MTQIIYLGNEEAVCPQSLGTNYLCEPQFLFCKSDGLSSHNIITMRLLYTLKRNANKRCFVLEAVLVCILV